MKSSTGAHFIALDHVRGLAALLVFVWHFTHGTNGYPVPFAGAPIWGPAVLFDEGHVGVALFMTLSGYLFAKLLTGRQILYPHFLLNRALRLLPLLALVFLIIALQSAYEASDIKAAYWFLYRIPNGLIFPTWPNGGWSITVEIHFYLLLPLLLWLQRTSKLGLVLLLAAAIAARWALFEHLGSVQNLSYWTIVGRIDQFVLGMLAFSLSGRLKGQHFLAAATVLFFITFYQWFDSSGGFYAFGGDYPSRSSVWTVLPTIEGLAFAILIGWYDNSFSHGRGRVSNFLSKVGEYSYSIYLLHFFVVFDLARFVDERLFSLSNIYVAQATAIVAFLLMIPIGYISMRFVERPFLKLRVNYLRRSTIAGPAIGQIQANSRLPPA